jgi:iron(III) transport system ATP-binding protein
VSSLRVQALTKRFDTVAGVFEVSFDVPAGGTIALIGPKGCGKTTVLRCIAGLETPDWGVIEIAGELVYDQGRGIDLAPEQRRLGIVLRSRAVWPHMTVAENVAFPLKVRGVPPAERLERASKILELVGLKGFEQRSPTLISDDQRFRAALARALVHEPGVVLFDEPLSGLDTRQSQQTRMELRMLRERLGFTAIYATHDQTEALGLADDIALMNNAAIETIGPAREVFRRPTSAFAARFFGMNVLEGRLLGPASDPRFLEVELSARLVIRGVAAVGHEFQKGGRVLACIHKEAVRVARAQRPEEAAGVIVGASYLGTGEEYVIDIAGIRLEAAGPVAGLAKGDRVHVSMTPDEWVLVR